MRSHSGDEETPAKTSKSDPQQTEASDNEKSVCPSCQLTPDLNGSIQTSANQPTFRPSPTLPLCRTQPERGADNNKNSDKTAGPENVANKIEAFVSEDNADKYTDQERASYEHHNCNNTALHAEIAALRTALATKLPDSVILQNEVQRLEVENVVLRWCNRNLASSAFQVNKE